MRDLPDPLLDEAATRFRLLGDATRLRILRFLAQEGEAPVGEIAAAAGCSQANVSKHLRLLHDARIVRRRAEGTMAYYRVIDPSVAELCGIVCGGIRRQVAREAALMGVTPGGQA
ncbi:helix-turn-helix transcriptional regulator [Tepidiforma sp.]|uniref:ArsR/SmtB family transcription factor n=1 Tax=Tepidiforma sp. TaxID=2682230 RepID=UPI002601EBAE|nr:metalloregulator ArsR/SmtB family transcription factor [Tepidiforma sp.]MCX7618977.1 metalloregulator ArsR/SmtB family transcription factor [Tepidiforma sp.]